MLELMIFVVVYYWLEEGKVDYDERILTEANKLFFLSSNEEYQAV
jgi:hypothetical protein